MQQRHGQSFKTRNGVVALTHGPADDLAAVEVQDGGQIKPAFLGFNIGDVRRPELVGAVALGTAAKRLGAMGWSWLLWSSGRDSAVAGDRTAPFPSSVARRDCGHGNVLVCEVPAQCAGCHRFSGCACGSGQFPGPASGLPGCADWDNAPLLPVVVAAGRNLPNTAEHEDRMLVFSSRRSVHIVGGRFGENAQCFFLKWCIAPASDGFSRCEASS